MIWLTWRQFRSQAAVVTGALVVLAIVLVATGPHLVNVYDSYLASCRHGGCPNVSDPVTSIDTSLQITIAGIVLVGPALIGIFWGAPLISRELEMGTYRLGWTQSVTRSRWLAIKIGLVGLLTVVATGLLTFMVSWWYTPIEQASQNQFQPAVFSLRGIVPVGYAAFAFALGLTLGLLVRRTLPAMAGTLVAFVLVRVLVTYEVRPHLLPAVHKAVALTANDVAIGISPSGVQALAQGSLNLTNVTNGWVYSTSIVNKAGHAPSASFFHRACPALANRPIIPPELNGNGHITAAPGQISSAFNSCAQRVAASYHAVINYQPANRFWAFQGLETALFVVAALALVGLSFWWVRHRIS
jgi:hypothetical protein